MRSWCWRAKGARLPSTRWIQEADAYLEIVVGQGGVIDAERMLRALSITRDKLRRYLAMLLDEEKIKPLPGNKRIIDGARYQRVSEQSSGCTQPYARPKVNLEALNRYRKKMPACQRMWNSMRHEGATFTVFSIACSAFASPVWVRRYINALTRCGIVRTREMVDGARLYRLILNTGRLHPLIKEDGVYCRNRKKLYPFLREDV